MANDKKFIAKNGLLTPQNAVIGSSNDTGEKLQVTGTSKLAGQVTITNSDFSNASLSVTNSAGHLLNSPIAEFKGDSDSLQITNIGVGDYKLVNSQQNNGIIFYDSTPGIRILYNNSARLDINSAGNRFYGLATTTIDNNRILTTADEGSGNGLDADTVDGLEANQFVRSDVDDIMAGNYTIQQDLTVSGNLTVSGTTTTVNTEEILLADNIITLNSNYTGSTPTENSGIEIERGTLDNPKILWDEANDYWKLISGNLTDLGRIITTADEGSGNGFDADTVDGLEASQFLRSDIDDTANGNITILGDLTIGDNVGGAQIIFDGVNNNRTLYSESGTIGFLNQAFNYSARSTGAGDWIVERDIQADRNLIAQTNITATTGDITATAGDVIAGDSIIAQNNITANTGNITATSGSVSAGTTVTAGTDVIGQRFVDADNNAYLVDPAGTSTMNNIGIDDDLFHNGDTDTKLSFGADDISLQTGGAERLGIDNDSVDSTVTFTAPSVGIDTDLFHNGDANTKISFTTDEIDIDTGGATRLTANTTGIHVTNLTASGNVSASIEVEAPIYYDKDDRTYYGDFASTSRINDITLVGQIIHDGDTNTFLDFNAADSFQIVAGGTGIFTATSTTVTVDGDLTVTGTITGGDANFTGDVSANNITATTAMYSPIYYDADNNGYYGDFAGTSVFNRISIDDYVVHSGDANTYIGFSAADTFDVVTDGTTRLTVDTTYVTSTLDGIFPNLFAFRYYDAENATFYTEPAATSRMNDISLVGEIIHDGDTDTYLEFNAADSFRVVTGGAQRLLVNNSYVLADNQMRSPIYYDNNNTAYYGDFAGTSVMNDINIDDYVRHNGDTDTYIGFDAVDNFGVWTNNVNRLRITNTNSTFSHDLLAPRFVDSGDNNYYVDPANASLSATLNGAVRIGSIANNTRWSDNTGNGGISLLSYGDDTATSNPTIAISGAEAGGYSLVYLNRIDASANPTTNGSRYIHFYHDGVDGSSIRGDSSGNLYQVLKAGTNWGFWTSGYSEALIVDDNGDVMIAAGASPTYTDGGDNTPLVGTNNPAKLHVGGSIYLNGNDDAIIFGRGTASFLKNQELAFGWGSGWYMTDATYLRVRNNTAVYSTGDYYGSRFYAEGATAYYLDPNGDSQLKTIDIDDYIRHRGDTNTYIGFPSNDRIYLATNGNARVDITNSTVTANNPVKINAGFTALDIQKTTNGSGVSIRMTDQSGTATQFGSIEYYHVDNVITSGAGAAFLFRSTEDVTHFVFGSDSDGPGTTAANRPELLPQGNNTGYIGNTNYRWQYVYANTGNFSGDLTASNMYASRYYDADDSTYYGDFASTSIMKKIQFDQSNVQAPTTTDATTGARLILYPLGSGRDYAIGIEGNHMWFNSDDGYKWYSDGTRYGELNTDYFFHTSDIRAPIFYDLNNTDYYVDPASSTRLNTIQALRYYFNHNTTYYMDQASGDYGSVKTGGATGGWSGYAIEDWWVFMANGVDNSGIYNDTDNEWSLQAARNSWTRLYANGVHQISAENGYGFAPSSMRSPIFYDSNDTAYYGNFAGGNTSTALRIGGVYDRLGFQTSGDGNNNILLRAQDYSHWVWQTSTNWGIFWAGNDNPYRSYFGTSNPNELVFIGSGNLRASIDLDNGNAYFQGSVAASDFLLNGGNENISLNPAYGSGGADLVLFDMTKYFESRVIQQLSSGENSLTGTTSEYVKNSDGPFAGSYVLRTSAYRDFDSDYIPVAPGEEIYGEVSVRRISGSGGLLYFGVRRYDKDKNPIGGNDGITYFVASAVNVTSTNWVTYRGHTTIPATHTPFGGSDGGACRFVRLILLVNYSAGGALREIGGVMLKRRNAESNLLADDIQALDRIDAGGIIQSAASVRAPIFYDTNDTNYYVDPTNISHIKHLEVAAVTNAASYPHAAIEVREFNYGGAQADTYAIAPRIAFHWGGRVASQIAVASNGEIRIINNPGTATENFRASIGYFDASARAPIFYDLNDTNYYVNPNVNSILHNVEVRNFGIRMARNYTHNSIWFNGGTDTNHVLWNNYYGGPLARTPSPSGFDGMLWNTYQGLRIRGGLSGVYDIARFSTDGGGNTNTHYVQLYANNVEQLGTRPGYALALNQMRAPIYYDYTSTSWYLDPAGSSMLNAVTVNQLNMRDRGDFITFYGNDNPYHSISSRDATGGISDDLRFNSYHDIYFNLDSNNNNSTGTTGFYIGQHGLDTGTIGSQWTFQSISDGNTYASSSFRAPIFYDTNNTAYYVDPTGDTNLTRLSFYSKRNWESAQNPDSGYVNMAYRIMANGRKVYPDEEFNDGANSTNIYNNAGGSALSRARIGDASAPNESKVIYRYTRSSGSNGTSPGFGGFYFAIGTTRNRTIVCKWRARMAAGRSFVFASNSYGSGGTAYWVTDNVGTGKWEEYTFVVRCGNGGSFSSTMFFYVVGGASTGTLFDLAAATCYIDTDHERQEARRYFASNSMYSPIYYDSNNSAYYLDPATTGTSLNVRGEIRNPSVWINDGDNVNNYNENIRLFNASNGVSVIAFSASGTAGTPATSILGYSDRLEIRRSNNWEERIYAGYAVARGSYRAPIFYDSNNTGYYVNPASVTQLNYVLADNWFRAQGSTGFYFESYGKGMWSPEAGSNAYGNVTTYGGGRNGWQGWGIGSRHVFMSTGGDNVGIHDNSRGWIMYWNGSRTRFDYGYTEAAGSFRAPIFYDVNNTAYYYNGASDNSTRMRGVSNETMAHMALSGQTRSSKEYYSARPRITGDQNYWVGSMGWSRVDMNTVADWGSGFIDSWSNPPNQPSGTSHWVGIQAYHYSNGSSRYGWQMVGGPIGNLRFRNTWASFSAWRTVPILDVNSGNGGAMYAGIYYDSNNAAYYFDGASTSRWNASNQDNYHTFNNYGLGVTGTYSASRLQLVFAMGAAYRPNSAGTSTANMYGIGWSHPNAGGLGGANQLNDHGMLIINNGTFRAAISSRAVFSSDVRTPIYYDWNDTGYYLDPNTTSNSALRIRGGALHGPNPTWGAYLAVGTNGHWSGSYASVATTNGNLHLDSQSGRDLYLQWYVGRTVFVSGAVQATIYYDRNSTAYYLDPASTSRFNEVLLEGRILHNGDTNTYMQFHVSDQWRVVTGGAERLEVNNLNTTVQNNLVVNGTLTVNGGGGFVTSFNPQFSGTALFGTTQLPSAGQPPGVSIAGANVGYFNPQIRMTQPSNLGTYFLFFGSSGTIGAIHALFGTTQYATSSDYRMKENIRPVENALGRISQLNPVRFNFIGQERSVDGFLAHEVQSIVPEAVAGEKDQVDEDGNPIYQGIDQSKLVPLLISAVQELTARLEALENA